MVVRNAGSSRYSSEQDTDIFFEVATVKEHIAAFGEIRKRLECFAAKLNMNPLFEFSPVF